MNKIFLLVAFVILLLAGCNDTPITGENNLFGTQVTDEAKPSTTTPPSLSGRIVYQTNGSILNLFVIDLSTGQTQQLTRDGSSSEPKWSPDGEQIAYVCGEEICMMDGNGENNSILTSPPGKKWNPSWSPDGQKISFVSNVIPYAHIYVMNLSDRSVTQLVPDFGGSIASPCWSADGEWIYFTSDKKGFNLYKARSDGSDIQQVTFGNTDDRPDLSEDDQLLVFRRIVKESSFFNGNEIVVLDLSSNEEIVLTDNTMGDDWPSFSPEGKWIVYASEGEGGLYQLMIVSPQGGTPIGLTFASTYGTAPSWTE